MINEKFTPLFFRIRKKKNRQPYRRRTNTAQKNLSQVPNSNATNMIQDHFESAKKPEKPEKDAKSEDDFVYETLTF